MAGANLTVARGQFQGQPAEKAWSIVTGPDGDKPKRRYWIATAEG